MTPGDFLKQWKRDHIDMGTQQADAKDLAEDLAQSAEREGIRREELEAVAGKDLETYIIDAIREAVEEELW